MLKGIVTAEDGALAVEHGADGVIVSNHGGRAEASNRSTIECLPEVVSAAGTGRPYLWGLAAFGQPGVEAVLNVLRRELEMVMRQAGTVTRSAITRAAVAGVAVR